MTMGKSTTIRKADLLHVLDGVPQGIAVLDKRQRTPIMEPTTGIPVVDYLTRTSENNVR